MNRQSKRLASIQEKLAQLERRLQEIVEGSARRLFPGARYQICWLDACYRQCETGCTWKPADRCSLQSS